MYLTRNQAYLYGIEGSNPSFSAIFGNLLMYIEVKM